MACRFLQILWCVNHSSCTSSAAPLSLLPGVSICSCWTIGQGHCLGYTKAHDDGLPHNTTRCWCHLILRETAHYYVTGRKETRDTKIWLTGNANSEEEECKILGELTAQFALLAAESQIAMKNKQNRKMCVCPTAPLVVGSQLMAQSWFIGQRWWVQWCNMLQHTKMWRPLPTTTGAN